MHAAAVFSSCVLPNSVRKSELDFASDRNTIETILIIGLLASWQQVVYK